MFAITIMATAIILFRPIAFEVEVEVATILISIITKAILSFN